MYDRGNGGAVIPLIEFSACRSAMATTVRVRALAEHAGQFEDGMALLPQLDQRWGPDGELAALADADPGEPVPVSWETLLLLSLADTTDTTDELMLDIGGGTATRLGTVTPPAAALRHQLAARLLAQELQDAGCIAVEVTVDALPSVHSSSWQGPPDELAPVAV